eukprot:CAMPEP_0203807818 /NCGR_PEP_ID=MMETSP0115-20131106/1268_1 /ASSEMBLY_ACC=CAM_ASM_000227 /TAXON_ID=33651 /ORGANISM="Bicosoecid sp, Strain ms1" /LENGTH=385 /DNA_ID=CAMNT_0050716503 /DNA_START=43 /DNA_END=1200 /DNA_ORIENTATION=-
MKAVFALAFLAVVGAAAAQGVSRCASIQTVNLVVNTAAGAGAACVQNLVGETSQAYTPCVEGSSCEDMDGETYTGTCSAVKAKKYGTTCSDNTGCQSGFEGGNLQCKDSKCRKNSGIGGACTVDADCWNENFECGADGWCVYKLTTGDECESSGDCPQTCLADDDGNMACGAYLSSGADCSVNQGSCNMGLYCKQDADDEAVYTCETRDVGDGETTSNPAGCEEGLGASYDAGTGLFTCEEPAPYEPENASGGLTGAECSLTGNNLCKKKADACTCAGNKKTKCVAMAHSPTEYQEAYLAFSKCVMDNCPKGSSTSRSDGTCAMGKCGAQGRATKCMEQENQWELLDATGPGVDADMAMWCSSAARVVIGGAAIVAAAVVSAIVA